MDKIFEAYENGKFHTIRGDFIDKLHSRVTVVGLLAVLILIVAKQYNDTAISCWLPTQFSDEQVN